MIPLSTVKVAVYGTFVPAELLRSKVKVTASPDLLTSSAAPRRICGSPIPV
jgi:hypothetical protein